MLGDAAWGELWATRPADQPDFGRRDERLLSAIAAQVAAGIARAELYGRMTTLAFEDGLTGLANRHALVERLDLALERGAEVALLLCDVDNLKHLNQGRGHHGGDWAPKAVAARCGWRPKGCPTRSCAATRATSSRCSPRERTPRPCGR